MNKENLTIAKVCIKFIIKQALLHFFYYAREVEGKNRREMAC